METKKKQVLIIGPAHPLRGGLASFNERLARQFQLEGMQASIYTFSLQYPSFLFPGTTQYSQEQAPNDISIHVKINSINPFNWYKIGKEIQDAKPDIVVVRYWLPFMAPCLGTILRLVKKNNHTKVICIADNILPHEKRFGDKSFTNYFIQPIDGFITMSYKVSTDLKQFTSKPQLQVVHPLYDNFGDAMSIMDARTKLKLDPNAKLLLFFGFIRRYKGLDLLLEAMSLLKEKKLVDPNIKLLVAGEFYENKQPYLDLIKQYGLEDSVILRTEFIQDSEVKYFISAADCIIQPYRNATQSGVTPLAYHFEKPMIVTNVGGLASMVPEGIGLITEPNPNSIAQVIADFFSIPREYMYQNIRLEKKKFGWDKITDAIVSLTR